MKREEGARQETRGCSARAMVAAWRIWQRKVSGRREAAGKGCKFAAVVERRRARLVAGSAGEEGGGRARSRGRSRWTNEARRRRKYTKNSGAGVQQIRY